METHDRDYYISIWTNRSSALANQRILNIHTRNRTAVRRLLVNYAMYIHCIWLQVSTCTPTCSHPGGKVVLCGVPKGASGWWPCLCSAHVHSCNTLTFVFYINSLSTLDMLHSTIKREWTDPIRDSEIQKFSSSFEDLYKFSKGFNVKKNNLLWEDVKS